MYKIFLLEAGSQISNLFDKDMITAKQRYAVYHANDYYEAEEYLKKGDINFFIFSINGSFEAFLDFLEAIQANYRYRYLPMAFLSPKLDYLLSLSLRGQCTCFLQKPICTPEWEKLIHIVKDHMNVCSKLYPHTAKYLEIAQTNEYVRINMDNILFIEAALRKCVIHTYDGKINTTHSLTKMLELAEGKGLYQTYRSFMINPDNISRIDKSSEPWTIHFRNYNETALVSRKYKREVEEMLLKAAY